MSTQMLVWIGAVVVVLAAAVVLFAVCWVLAWLVERVWDRLLRDRVAPLLEGDTEACDAEAPDGDHCWFDAGHDGLHTWEQRLDPLPPPLPPERTWEQMTSHQLPITPATLKTRIEGMGGTFEPARERRMPGWEAEQRQAYAALDLEYPSGLLARVREAAQ